MIPFLDLKQVNQEKEAELREAAERVIGRGWYLLGEELTALEEELSDYLSKKTTKPSIIGCASGLDALRLIFKAYLETGQLSSGDEVIVPANTYIASVLAVTDCGLTPRMVEPDLQTLNLDFSLLENAVSSKTKAVLVVHLYGRSCWSEQFARWAKEKQLLIIEDNAQAFGAAYQGKKTGTLGDAAALSFYPTKNLGALGDAGAVVTQDKTIEKIIRSLRNYGTGEKYICDRLGYNSRMDEIQAAILRVKLKYVDAENRYRQKLARLYSEAIKNKQIILPTLPDDQMQHVWHLFTILCQNRNYIRQELLKCGVQTEIHYPVPPHKQGCYPGLNTLSLPVTERIHEQILSLPLSPAHTEKEIIVVANRINEIL